MIDWLLARTYAAAVTGRGWLWRVRRPLLVGVRVIVTHGNDVLLVRHRSGTTPWSLPGGGVGAREPLSVAASREVFEETGVPAQIERLLGTYDYFGQGASNYIAVFVATPHGPPHLRRSLEIADARYFPANQLPTGTDGATQARVAEWLGGFASLHGAWMEQHPST